MQKNDFAVAPGQKCRLADYDPGSTGGYESEEEAREEKERLARELARYQDILLAHETYGVLTLFQGMDGAGKDATIKHVMSSADPQACTVTAFKAMTKKQLTQDYLRRASEGLPDRGQIGIFNRSYYEQVAIDQVHPEKLEEQTLPPHLKEENIWRRRYREINDFEHYLVDNGIVVLKFFLHLSKAKQRERLLERLELPEKRWKFSSLDIEDRAFWDRYMEVYEDIFTNTSTEWAPWHIIPADNRWVTHVTVSSVVVSKLKSLHSDYPEMSEEKEREMAGARESLEAEQR